MTQRTREHRARRSVRLARLGAAAFEALEGRRLFSFGVTTTASSFTIDTGANTVFTVARSGGDLTSIKYKGTELTAPYSATQRYAHYESGLSSSAAITLNTDPNGQWIEIACDDTGASGVGVIQYYVARKGQDNIYMATDSPGQQGEMRFITYLNKSVFTHIEDSSDISTTDSTVEGSDVFVNSTTGITKSKFYTPRQMINNAYHGVTGNGVGAWMNMGSRETSSGGPFFKDIDFQTTSSATEMYNYMFSGHTQTDAFRTGLQGPYALQFTDGSAPAAPDYSFLAGLNLAGYVGPSGRGTLVGTETGVPAGHAATVTLANPTAQYWASANATTGQFSITGVKAGTYTETLYDTELAVGTRTVTVAAGGSVTADIVDTYYNPAAIWRIGTWDGTPGGFLNADKIGIMHPSDSRMSPWVLTQPFVIGTSADSQWPLAQFKDVNNAPEIDFTLTAAQAATPMTLRIGITLAFAGGRDYVVVNGGQTYAYTSPLPGSSTQPNSRGITRGTYRGNNTLYTYNIPASALRAGTNTINLTVNSGSSGTGFLSPSVTYDAIDLVPTASLTNAPVVTTIAVTPSPAVLNPGAQQTFVASAKDQFGNPIAANFDFSDAAGTVTPAGLYTAPLSGSDTVTATSTSNAVAGSASVFVDTAAPTVATAAGASPNPVHGTTVALSVLGADDSGESNLTYTWSTTGTNPGPVSYSANGTNAAKNAVATLGAFGTYNFLVTITDAVGHTVTSSVTVVNRDTIVRYKADETGGATLSDSSGNNNPATLSGSYAFGAGVSGNSVDLTGGSASLPAGIVTGVNDFTVAAWVKPDALNTWSRVFDFGTGTTAYMFLTPRASGTNAVRFAITSGGTAAEKQLNGPALTVGVWTHLAVTLSGNTATLYVNGVAYSTNAAVTTHPAALGNTTNNNLGKSQFTGDPAFLGSIDDFRLYGRSLSAAEIQQLANPVKVTSQIYDYSTGQALTMTFNRDVSASIANSDLLVQNLTTGAVVPASSVGLAYSGTTAKFTIGNVLADGNYRATLPVGSVTDSSGLTLNDDVTYDFFVLAGDANHDRTVNLTDFGLFAAGFGATAGATWASGDFNHDGKVDLTDFGLLSANFGATLPPPASAATAASAAPAAATPANAAARSTTTAAQAAAPVRAAATTPVAVAATAPSKPKKPVAPPSVLA